MGKFLLVYKGGGSMPEGAEEQKAVMDAWMGWFGGLGDSVVDMGNPLGEGKSLGKGASTGLTGYSLISADSLDDAVAKAGGCPILESDTGGVEVYETFEM